MLSEPVTEVDPPRTQERMTHDVRPAQEIADLRTAACAGGHRALAAGDVMG